MNMILPTLREAEAETKEAYHQARLRYLEEPNDANRLACSAAAQAWADAARALHAATDDERRAGAAEAIA